jgi:hypothetical protein
VKVLDLVKSPSTELSPLQRTMVLREKTAEIEYYTAMGLAFFVGMMLFKSFFGGRR